MNYYDSILFLSSTIYSPLLKYKSCRVYFCLTCITESVGLNLGCSCFSKFRAFLEVSMISLEIIINVLMGNIFLSDNIFMDFSLSHTSFQHKYAMHVSNITCTSLYVD